MADTSTCTARACQTVTPGLVDACPRCGGRVLTSRRVRMLGWVLLGIGFFLIAFMGYITLQLYPSLARPGDVTGAARFSGDAAQAGMILNLFWLVIAVGALSVLNGAWQIATGRRNMILVAISLLVAAVLLFTTWETTEALKNGTGDATAPDKPA